MNFKINKKLTAVLFGVTLTFLAAMIVATCLQYLREKRRFQELYGDALASYRALKCEVIPDEIISHNQCRKNSSHKIEQLDVFPVEMSEYLTVEGVSESYYSDPFGIGEMILTKDIIFAFHNPYDQWVALVSPRVYHKIGKEWYWFLRDHGNETIEAAAGETTYITVSIYNFLQPEWEPEGTFLIRFSTYGATAERIYSQPAVLEKESSSQN